MEINERIYQYLKKTFSKGSFSHAYIFCGPEGTGKFDMLSELFFLVNKERLGLTGESLILIERLVEKKGEIDRKKDISVNQIRQGINRASYFASPKKKIFFIIREADKLSNEASNSLLKIIEEPPPNVMVFLLCEKEENLLITIRSRCQKIFFNPIPEEKIREYLLKKYPQAEENKIKKSAAYSRGRYKLAEKMVIDNSILKQREELFETFKKTVKLGWLEALMLVEKITNSRDDVAEIIDEWVWSLNELLVQTIKKDGNQRSEKKILTMIKDLLLIKERIDNANSNKKIQLENFFIKTI
jgi:DNA polymerase-3 subunit delta'